MRAPTENDCGIFYEILDNHDALVLRERQEAEVRIDPVDRVRRSYPIFVITRDTNPRLVR